MWHSFLLFFSRSFEAGARTLSLLHSWASASLSAIREGHFGKLFVWSAIASAIALCGSFLKLGLEQSLAIFRGVGSDPLLASSDASSVLSFVSHSLSPWWAGLSTRIPPFWRWFGWWIGVDWIVWLFACSAIFVASAWFMSILIRCISSIIRLILRFV